MPTLDLEFKSRPLRYKDLGTSDPGTLRVYAAEFNSIDRAGEKIARNAFRNLTEFVRSGFITTAHNWQALPVATIDTAKADSTGLLITGTWHSTPEAQACRQVARERLARGKQVSMSIGYQVADDDLVTENGKTFRFLRAIDLFEVSFVNVPANPAAVALEVKSHPRRHVERADPMLVRLAQADYERMSARLGGMKASPAAIHAARVQFAQAEYDLTARPLRRKAAVRRTVNVSFPPPFFWSIK